MGVSNELLCSFELLKPLDSSALKSHIKKGRNKRNSMLNSPVSINSNTSCVPFPVIRSSIQRSSVKRRPLSAFDTYGCLG